MAYYQALEAGAALEGFYATEAEAGELGPVVKVGSGKDEFFVGRERVVEAVRRVSRTFSENRVASRGPMMVTVREDVALLADTVWWSGRAEGKAFGSLTRWTGVARRTERGWRLVQLHVSEEVE
jgi:hypothetical protein